MADIVTDISVNKNWNARKGANNPVVFTFTQNGVAFDISSYNFSVQLRKFGRETNLLNLIEGSGVTNNGALGTLNVVFTSDNLSSLVADDYYWQMTVVHPDTLSYLWFQGTFNLFSELYTGDLTTTVNESIDLNGTTVNASITLAASGGGGGSSYTFTNGLTESSGTVSLGGALTGNVSITGNQTENVTFGSATYANALNSFSAFTDIAVILGSGDVAGATTDRSSISLSPSQHIYTWNNAASTSLHQYFLKSDGHTFTVTGSTRLLLGTSNTTFNLGSDVTGDTYYRNSSGYFTRLPAGTDGHVLTLASGIPSWAAPTSGSISTQTSTATLTPSPSYDCFELTAQAEALTIANPSPAYGNFEIFVVRIKDNGTARALTFGNKYRAQGSALPTTTTISKVMNLVFMYDSTADKYDVKWSEEV